VTEREIVTTQAPVFDVATESAHLRDVHDIDGSPTCKLVGDMRASSGLAVADFDCDGYEDIGLRSTSRPRLFRNAAEVGVKIP